MFKASQTRQYNRRDNYTGVNQSERRRENQPPLKKDGREARGSLSHMQQESGRRTHFTASDCDADSDGESYSEDVTAGVGRFAHRSRLHYTQPSSRRTVDDEWLKIYGKRTEIPLHALGVRIVEFWRQQAGPTSAGLSDLDLLFSNTPKQSDVAHKLNQFTQGHGATLDRFLRASSGQLLLVYPSDPLPVDEIAWIDHRVWVDGFTSSLTIPQQPEGLLRLANLQRALRTQNLAPLVAQQRNLVYRRLVYIADPDGPAVLALAREASLGMVHGLYALFHGYLTARPVSRCQILRSPVAYEGPLVLTFQLAFFALSREIREDPRQLGSQPLRLNIPLSFLSLLSGDEDTTNENSFMCQGVTSFSVTIFDKRLWDGVCLNDEWFMEYSMMGGSPDIQGPVQRPGFKCPAGLRPVQKDVTDPITNQEASEPYADPRAYFLKALENSLEDIADYSQELCDNFEGPIETHRNIFLPHAPRVTGLKRQTLIPEPRVRTAISDAKRILERLEDSLSQQCKAIRAFLAHGLCLDYETLELQSPLFIGLNQEIQDGNLRNIHAYILQSIERLEKIRISITDLRNRCKSIDLEPRIDDRKKYNRLAEQDADIDRQRATRAMGMTLPHYALAAFALPLALYSVPVEITRLPTSLSGFLGVLFLLPVALLLPAIVFLFPHNITVLRQRLI